MKLKSRGILPKRVLSSANDEGGREPITAGQELNKRMCGVSGSIDFDQFHQHCSHRANAPVPCIWCERCHLGFTNKTAPTLTVYTAVMPNFALYALHHAQERSA